MSKICREKCRFSCKQICADGAESVTSNTSDTVEGNDLLDDDDNLKHLSKTIMRKFWS